MVESMDDAIGTLLDAVDKAGAAENTIIVFTSDNGGNMYSQVDGTVPTTNAPLRGGKACIFDGGTRVPCIVVWPGVTEPGSRCEERIQSSDFYPTLANNLGLEIPKDHKIDGMNVFPSFKGESFLEKRYLLISQLLRQCRTGYRHQLLSTQETGSLYASFMAVEMVLTPIISII